jgi:type III secretion system FlhB-like substrate exporter
MIISFELVTKKGAWYSFSESIVSMAKDDGVEIQTQHQGMSSLYDYIENNKNVFEWLLKKVNEIIA